MKSKQHTRRNEKPSKRYTNKKTKYSDRGRFNKFEVNQTIQQIGFIHSKKLTTPIYSINFDIIPKPNATIYNKSGREIGKVLEVFGTKSDPKAQIQLNESNIEDSIYSYKKNLFYSNYDFHAN